MPDLSVGFAFSNVEHNSLISGHSPLYPAREMCIRHSVRSYILPQSAGKLMKCSVTRSRLVDMLNVSLVHTDRLVVRAYKDILCCVGKDNARLTGQTIKFTVNWVDHSLLRALRNIISHGSIQVSADKDKEFYINKLQTVHGVDLLVCANRCCCY